MKHAVILSALALCISLSCSSQTSDKGTTLYSKIFDWTISIPPGFDTVSTEKWTQMQNRGMDAIQETFDTKVENKAKTLFVFKKDQFNYFEANYQPFDPAKDGSYLESFREVNNILYGTLAAQINGADQTSRAAMDSSSSTQVVSGLTFQTFQVRISFPGNVTMHWILFSRLFGKKELTINMVTVDEQQEKELLRSWLGSRFGQ